MAKNMSCLRQSAMFIPCHSIYLDLVIRTIFCQLESHLTSNNKSFIHSTNTYNCRNQTNHLVYAFLLYHRHIYSFSKAYVYCFQKNNIMNIKLIYHCYQTFHEKDISKSKKKECFQLMTKK